MTESATPAAPARPVLAAVPGPSGPSARGRGRTSGARPALQLVGPGIVAPLAAARAAKSLGTLFAPVAASLGNTLATRAAHLLRGGSPEVWAAAVVFLLAEESRLFEYDCCVTRTSFAKELGFSLPALRTRVTRLRAALEPLRLHLPGPADDLDDPEVVEQWHSLRA